MSSNHYREIDVATEEGQAGILADWSSPVVHLEQAAWILKLTHAEFHASASRRVVTAPPPEAVAARADEIEATF